MSDAPDLRPTLILPDWPAPATVGAFVTTRETGPSQGEFACFNPSDRVGDNPAHVALCRRLLQKEFKDERPLLWLNQVHGARVQQHYSAEPPEADAAVAFDQGHACVVLTADCLPVFFCDRRGRRVGVAHAGWRGLAGGVLEASVAALGVPPGEVLAWLGPAISNAQFEVGPEVADRFPHAESTTTWGTPSVDLRRAVLERDGGMCIFPGCGRTDYLEMHHRIHRADGGPTVIWNLETTCWTHHHLAHEVVVSGVIGESRDPRVGREDRAARSAIDHGSGIGRVDPHRPSHRTDRASASLCDRQADRFRSVAGIGASSGRTRSSKRAVHAAAPRVSESRARTAAVHGRGQRHDIAAAGDDREQPEQVLVDQSMLEHGPAEGPPAPT